MIALAFRRLVGLIICLNVYSTTYAQDSLKVDRIVMVNGEIKEGSVKAISESTITFIHSGETLGYTFKKDKIGKIEFSSVEQYYKVFEWIEKSIITIGLEKELIDELENIPSRNEFELCT